MGNPLHRVLQLFVIASLLKALQEDGCRFAGTGFHLNHGFFAFTSLGAALGLGGFSGSQQRARLAASKFRRQLEFRQTAALV
jgi:hypothetical protein